ncbi:hypothetical protein PENTCL1PPCAC_2933, partial [Pristionchus entomophagus]
TLQSRQEIIRIKLAKAYLKMNSAGPAPQHDVRKEKVPSQLFEELKPAMRRYAPNSLYLVSIFLHPDTLFQLASSLSRVTIGKVSFYNLEFPEDAYKLQTCITR